MGARDRRGQATVELLAAIPVLIATATLVIWLLGAGHEWMERRAAERAQDRETELARPSP